MFFTLLVFLSAFLIEAIGTYVSVIGLSALFASNPVVIALAVALDIGKVVAVSFVYKYWSKINLMMKTYMTIAAMTLVLITSTGAFGFLSGEFQKAIAGNSQQTIVIQSLTDEQGRLQKRKEEIDKQIAQLPQNSVRGRRQLMQQFGPEIQRLNDRLAEIDKKLPELKVANIEKELHVGPIMYVADAFDTTPEKAVKWVILIIIFVFDPLAIALLIAGNFLLAQRKNPAYEPDDGPLTDEQHAAIKRLAEDSGIPQNRVATSSLFPTASLFNGGVPFDDSDIMDNPLSSMVNHDLAIKMAPKRKYTRKPKPPSDVLEPGRHLTDKQIHDAVAAMGPIEPAREKVVIKKTVKKPEPPKVVVETEGDKEVIKIEKPLMKSQLEGLNVKADVTEDKSPSKSLNVYSKDE